MYSSQADAQRVAIPCCAALTYEQLLSEGFSIEDLLSASLAYSDHKD